MRKGTSRKKANGEWLTRRAGSTQVLQSGRLAKLPWLVHGFSTRRGGASTLCGARVLNLGFTDWDKRSAVEANRRAFVTALANSTAKHAPALVTLRQIHSDVIHEVNGKPAQAPRGDAATTRASGNLLAVQTADCLPILLVDTKRRAVAAVHAGWRGTLRRIAAKTLGRMRMLYGTRPEDVVAAIGPGIGACCYEVGHEVVQAFAAQFAEAREWFTAPPVSGFQKYAPSFDDLATGVEPLGLKWLTMAPPGHEPPPPRMYLDLVAANRWQLLDAGVRAKHIVASDLCTACRTDFLFSHRREQGYTGRQMGVIGIRN